MAMEEMPEALATSPAAMSVPRVPPAMAAEARRDDEWEDKRLARRAAVEEEWGPLALNDMRGDRASLVMCNSRVLRLRRELLTMEEDRRERLGTGVNMPLASMRAVSAASCLLQGQRTPHHAFTGHNVHRTAVVRARGDASQHTTD